jgi:uncharacterized protein YecE (DUF72 family)
MSAGIHIGTSGWHYPHWRGNFYPARLPARAWLGYYAERLSCVEINNSFYRLPALPEIRSWSGQTPEDFRFAVKAWRVITHRHRLKDCAPFIADFLAPARRLGRRLGPILFQLPPRWRCNMARLRDFLALLPRRPGMRYAFEFRDPDWHREEVYALLARFNAAFCIFELGALRAPPIATADFVYVRLHGPAGAYAGSYAAPALRRWAARLRDWHREGRDVWLFFDNDEAGYAVRNALTLRALVERAP